MLLLYKVNVLYLLFSYAIHYFGLLTSYNTVGMLYFSKNDNNNNVVMNSGKVPKYLVRIISSFICGVYLKCVPLILVMTSKQYYYIENGHDTIVETNYKYWYILGSLFLFSAIPYIALTVLETAEEFQKFVSKPNSERVIRLRNFIAEHGYVYLFNILFEGYLKNFSLGLASAIGSCFFQYSLLYSIDLNISIAIDWKYLIASILLKALGVSLGISTTMKYNLTFMFDKESEQLMLILAFFTTIFDNTSYITMSQAFILSLNEPGVMGCNSMFIMNTTVLAITSLLIERCLTFVIFYNTPTILSYNELKSVEEKFMNEVIKSKNLLEKNDFVGRLVREMVPKHIANKLITGENVTPEKKWIVVFFSDIKGFSQFADGRDAMKVFFSLDRLFSIMDRCVSQFEELYKIESSDAYMVVGTADDADDPDAQDRVVHAMINFSILVRKAVQLVPLDENQFVEIRIGLHCGDAVSGLLGNLTPRYCFFGETINHARKIEATGSTNRIHVSAAFASVVKHLPGSDSYALEKREGLETFWLENSMDLDIDAIYSATFQYIQKKIEEFTAGKPELLNILSTNGVESDVGTKTLKSSGSFPLLSVLSSDSLLSLAVQQTVSDFADISRFEYEVLNVPDDYVSISKHIMCVFEGLFDLNSINVDERVLFRFIKRISRSYRTVPYHNFFHGFCVVQFTGAMLIQCGLQGKLPDQELFCLVVCALIHDVDHPGTNNSFEVATQSRLSVLYNDISVLENHHIALGFSIMKSSSDYNVILQWSAKDQKHFRQLAIRNILATDMACHNDLVKDITCRALSTPQFDYTQEEERVSLYKILLHSADLSNTVRPFHISSRICSYIAEEFRSQARKEESMGLPVTPFMVLPNEVSVAMAEIGFLKGVAMPYFRPQALCFESASALVYQVDNNIEKWTQRKSELENDEIGIIEF